MPTGVQGNVRHMLLLQAQACFIRFALLATGLSMLAHVVGMHVVERLLPAIQAEIETLDKTYAIDDIRLDRERDADQVVRVRVHQAHCLDLGDRFYCGNPAGWAVASAPAGSILLVAVMVVSLGFTWPVKRKREYLWRSLLVVPALILACALDVPMLLWAAIWDLQHAALTPNSLSPLLIWADFMQGGGRGALAIVVAAGVCILPTAWV